MFFPFCYAALIVVTLMALWIHWTYSVREKSRKRFNFKQLLTDYCRDEACKNKVYDVRFCVTLFQNLFSFFS